MKKILPTIALSCLMGCTAPGEETPASKPGFRADFNQFKGNRMTPEMLWSFGRISGVTLSPDKQTILYGVTYSNIEEDRSYRDLYTLPIAGGTPTRLTNTATNEFEATWRPDGKKIGFLSSESGSVQLWEMNPDGSQPHQVSNIEEGISGFKYAPDQSKIMYIQELRLKDDITDIYPDLPKANAHLMDDLMYRHWDHWVENITHIFVTDYSEKGITDGTDIMEGEPWEAPVRPFDGTEQISWSPDSKNIIYSCRKKEGRDYAVSTNTDLYQYNLSSGKTANLTEGMMGYDKSPVFSPDGQYLAWESQERDGYEADVVRLAVKNLKSGKTTIWDNTNLNVHGLTWREDSKALYFISDWHATDQIYMHELDSHKTTKLTEGVHNYRSILLAKDKFVTTRVSMSKPVEIYAVDRKSGDATELSLENKPLLDKITMGKVEERWIKTTDNKDMLVWVIYPPNFDPNKKYPTLLYCQGGPQSTVSQFWSIRWNFQMMAANDYIIVAPNRRGLPGFGKEWNEQISKDYGGQNMKDYFSAIDALAKEPYVDEDHLGAVGASYGGFSVYWLAGNHNKRFKAFISHCGIFNFEQMYATTEEMWFVNFDMGGAYWDKTNKAAQRSYGFSPHKFVQNWDTPILVVHNAKDFRIPFTQGMGAFNSARLKGVPARFLYFPEENHWVLKAQNGILWQRVFFDWLDKYLKK